MSPAKNPTSHSSRSRASASRTGRSRSSTARTRSARATSSRATSSRATSSRVSFKEPPALKRLHKSLDNANDALSELRVNTGREVSQSARDLYKDLRTFVSSARRHSGRLTTALQRDFDRAQKRMSSGAASGTSRKRSASARGTKRASTTRRASSKR
jgi:hypothetical protein